MSKPDVAGACQYALQRLAAELPSAAHYHCLGHTRDDVLPAAQQFAGHEQITGAALSCLITAVHFHDLGHIEQALGHEAISARIAAEQLPGFGFTHDHIALIKRLIMATKVPQHPVTLLEKTIVDADMDSLGREDFLETSYALRRELAEFGRIFSNAEWYAQQIAFMHAHTYFTSAARMLRGPGKRRNIAQLEQLLAVNQVSDA
ncbi:MAG: phosphohydrolase [Anaerolineae bacterium]|nr:phosphohydrolase [Anaerolineae bacterium]